MMANTEAPMKPWPMKRSCGDLLACGKKYVGSLPAHPGGARHTGSTKPRLVQSQKGLTLSQGLASFVLTIVGSSFCSSTNPRVCKIKMLPINCRLLCGTAAPKYSTKARINPTNQT